MAMSIHHFPHTMCCSLLLHQCCTACYEQRSPRPNWPRSFSVCDVNVLRTQKVLFISSICNILRIRFRCVPVPEYTFFLYVRVCFITFGWTHSPANSTRAQRYLLDSNIIIAGIVAMLLDLLIKLHIALEPCTTT